MANYMEYKLMGGSVKIMMKAGVVPHKFECQGKEPRQGEASIFNRATSKRKREVRHLLGPLDNIMQGEKPLFVLEYGTHFKGLG